MQTVKWRYIKISGKTTYFAPVLQSLYMSGERSCIFLSVYGTFDINYVFQLPSPVRNEMFTRSLECTKIIIG